VLVADHHSLDQLQVLADAIPQKRSWKRLQAVLLAKRGWTAADIATSLSCSLRAVKNWVARYNRGGLEALRERPRTGRPRRLAPEHYPRLKQRLEAPPRPADGVCTLRAADVRRILEYEIVVEQIDAIAAEHPEKQVRTYFEDEARFGTQGTITRVWSRKGSRPRAVRQNGRQWLYVLMAVCASTGAASALIMPELNTAVVNLFLEQFSRELPAGVHAVLIWDGAGYHTGGDLVVPGNVSLIRLPPYSPELNPVENLWHYLRSHHWSNREYEGYKGLQEEAVRSLRAVCQDDEKLKSICNADYVSRRV
jgi:transposase